MPDTYIQLPDGSYVQVPPDASPAQLMQFKIKLAGMQPQATPSGTPDAVAQSRQQMASQVQPLPAQGGMMARLASMANLTTPRPPGGGEEAALASGAGPGLGMMLAPQAIANPGTTIASMAGGAVGGYGARKGAEALGASPKAADYAETGGQILGALASGAGAQKLAGLPDALKASAGGTLGNIKAVAGKVPVNTGEFGDTALELWEQSQRGASLPMPVRKLVNRITNPGSSPMTYAEAKDFQGNISSLLANPVGEAGAALKNPNTYRLVTDLNQKLKGSLEQASQLGGFDPNTFSGAMGQYHQAGHASDVLDFSKEAMMNMIKEGAKWAFRGAVGTAAGKTALDIMGGGKK